MTGSRNNPDGRSGAPPDAADVAPSKSQRKRDMLDLQVLGEQLVKLRRADLANLDLPEALLDAIVTARDIRSHEALRRQLQFVGRLMRRVDATVIRDALEAIDAAQRAQARASMPRAERR